MKESTIIKIIETASSPVAQHVQDIIEKTGKVSAVGGGAAYTAETLFEQTSNLPQIAAIVSITGGLVWIAKMLFDMWLSWLKHRRGDLE